MSFRLDRLALQELANPPLVLHCLRLSVVLVLPPSILVKVAALLRLPGLLLAGLGSLQVRALESLQLQQFQHEGLQACLQVGLLFAGLPLIIRFVLLLCLLLAVFRLASWR